MQIDNGLIREAKEKLGDRNAEIIAELLHLDDYKYDARNKKACCPYHDEDTPSFVYDAKSYFFKCFGCGVNVDIIDAMISSGLTFSQASKKLFEYADMEYDFAEVGIKSKSYIYPKGVDASNDKTMVYEYLATRKISKETVDYLDIRQDNYENCVFNFYSDNDTLDLVKYRPARKIDKKSGDIKTWCEKGASTRPILFNMNRINPNQPLLVTEGEIDCASAIESGFLNAVSVPIGSGNLSWIEENWEWLQQFKSIIICADSDKAGEKMKKECVTRLGAYRTKLVQLPKDVELDGKRYPINDLNDCLRAYGKETVLDCILNAKDIPITSVARLSEIEELNVHEMEGFETGIKPLDNEWMKIFTGGLTIITGTASSGKTTVLNQFALMSMDADRPVFLFSRELLNGMSLGWLNTVAAGRRNMKEIHLPNGKSYHVVTDEAKKKIRDYYDDKLYIYKDEEGNDADSLLESMKNCVTKKGIKTAIIDNLMTCDLKASEQERNQAQTDFINRLIKFSMEYDVSIILVAHVRKMQSGQEIGLFDVAGSSNIVNLATRTLSLKRVTEKEKADEKCKYREYDVCIGSVKDRIFGSTKEIYVHYDKISRRFYTSYEEFDRQYKWDTNTYTDKLECPVDFDTPFE